MHAKYIWTIGLVAGPALGGFRVVKPNFRNVPEGEDFFTKNVDHVAQYFSKK